jgi:ATPase subunit of ABC transporter with duplicated ATPase domains
VFNIVHHNYIEQFIGCKPIARQTGLYYNKLGEIRMQDDTARSKPKIWTRCELMSILTVTKLSHGFGDRAIFEDVSFRLLKGEHIGLIGANGEGKSTFMSMITGSLEPDAGKIEWSKRVRVGYLDQHAVLRKGSTVREALKTAFQYLLDLETEMNEMYEQMGSADPDELERLLEDVGTIQDTLTNNDYYVIDAKVEEIARGLGLDEIGLDRDVHDLSGGQRTKVLLAKLLLEKPDILLLDEPTNYLDEAHIEWLRRYLQQYENAFILISHDIPFLNSVVNLIYHVENRQLNRYTGDYDQFVELHSQKKSQLESAYKRQQQEIAELKDFVARNKARVSTRNMAMSRQKKLDKMELIELDKEKPKPQFNFKEARTSAKLVFETKELIIGYEEPLSKPLNLRMERGQKVAIVGANGIGKTTLLRSILGEIHSLSGSVLLGDYLEIGYFEQEVKGSNNQTCIEEIWNVFPSFSQFEVRAALARCGLTTQHIESRIDVLSGGEKAKVRLCKLINRESNLLVLDEPTNHLDADAKNELKRALQAYKGSILLISHEPEFYRDIVTDIWNGESWTTKIF